MRLLLYIAAAASAQTRITNWEEQHQRFVRQAAFEELLSWFRAISASRGGQRCVDAGGFVVPGLSQRPGGIRNVFLPNGAKKGDALLRIPRQCLLSHKETRGYLKEYNLEGAFEQCSSNECAATEPLREPHATSVWLMAARKEPSHVFAPYFDVFPDNLENFPVAWDDARLRRTLPPFVAERVGHLKRHFDELWSSLKALVPDLESKYKFEDFCDAKLLVDSRGAASIPCEAPSSLSSRRRRTEGMPRRHRCVDGVKSGRGRGERQREAMRRWRRETHRQDTQKNRRRNFGGHVDDDDDFQLNLLPVLDSFNHGGRESFNSEYRFVEDTNDVLLEASADVPVNGDLSITYGPHRTQEDLFVEYGFAIDCSNDSSQCREVATVPYDGAYRRLEAPTLSEVEHASVKGLMATGGFREGHKPFLDRVLRRAKATFDSEPANTATGRAQVARAALTELLQALDNATSTLPPRPTDIEGPDRDALLVTRGYHDVLDGWRALAKGASLTPDAEVVRVRVQTKEPHIKLGWLHGNETCVDRHESCGPWSNLGECKNNPTWMRAHCPVSCGVVSGCTSGKPKILVEDVSTETWTSVKAVVGDLLLALRGDEVLFVREVDGPADVTVVAS